MGIKDIARKIAVVSQNPSMSYISVQDFILLGRIPHQEGFRFFDSRSDVGIAEKCMKLNRYLPFQG